MLDGLHLIPNGHAFLAFMVLVPAVTAAWTTLVARALGERRRWARNAAAITTVAVALAVVAPLFANGNLRGALTTAMPWFAVQTATLTCLFTPASNRWFYHEAENRGATRE